MQFKVSMLPAFSQDDGRTRSIGWFATAQTILPESLDTDAARRDGRLMEMRGEKRPLLDSKTRPVDQWIADLRARFPTERYVDKALTRKLLLRNGPPYTARSVELITEQLQKFLERRLAGEFVVSNILPLTGGTSNEQFSFELTWTDERSKRRTGRFVLRVQPKASIVETHRLREYQVMRALDGVIPVPAPSWIDAEGDEFGAPALISAFCEGVSRPPVEGEITGPRQGYGKKFRVLLGPQFVGHLASLAKFDWTSRHLDLSAFDVPRTGTNEAVLWAINWWQRVWEEDSLEASPLIALAAEWLRENAPPIDHISLVHADYRGGNFLFRPEDGRITAILDWELVHLGDRHEDIAYILSPIFGELDESGELLVGGFYPREEFLARFEKLSGMPLDLQRIRYYEVFCNWRSAIICLSTAARCAVEQTTHQDILVAWIATIAPATLDALHCALAQRI